MRASPLRDTEEAAVLPLHALQVLDSAPEPEFDALVNAAALACGVPISMLSLIDDKLIDDKRQWFKAQVGLPGVTETPREQAFCFHAVAGGQPLEVADASRDPRFADNPLVTGEPGIRFYASAPLRLSDGSQVGTLCVIDRKPRELTVAQRNLLQQLALVAVQTLERRRSEAQRRHLDAVLDRTGRLARVGGWELDLRTQVLTWTRQTRRIHEVDDSYVPEVNSAIHFYADDARPLIAAAVQAGIEHGTPWDLELPLVTAKGRAIWVRGLGDVEVEDGRAVRLVGAFQDITELRLRSQELQQEQTLRSKFEQQVHETERLLRERGEMLDVMAHEVRQPLNNASAALQSAVRALSSLSASGEPAVTPRLQRAQTVLAQVLASMDNTLAVAALLARADPIERQYTDIDALLQVVVADLPQPERARVHLQRRTRTRTASMDMSLMRLALRNLLSNALKYSPADTPVMLRISDSDDPLALIMDIADHGGGIAASRLPRLFERNAHRGQPRSHAKQGLGLGLYIVRRVMELHGGSVFPLVNGPAGLTMRLVVNQPLGD